MFKVKRAHHSSTTLSLSIRCRYWNRRRMLSAATAASSGQRWGQHLDGLHNLRLRALFSTRKLLYWSAKQALEDRISKVFPIVAFAHHLHTSVTHDWHSVAPKFHCRWMIQYNIIHMCILHTSHQRRKVSSPITVRFIVTQILMTHLSDHLNRTFLAD